MSMEFDRFFYKNFYLLFLFFPFGFFIWFVSVLAELNRSPFDFSEGESELVSGFNIDFGSCCFTLIFLSEYGSIFFFMYLTSFLFFNYSLLFFIFFVILVLWVRSVFPRYRFDKLMNISWKLFFPFLSILFLNFFVSSF